MIQELLKKPKLLSVGIGIGGLLLVYIIGLLYFQSHFLPGTSLGNQSIAFQSPEGAAKGLQDKLSQYQVELVEENRSLGVLPLSELRVNSDYTQALQTLLEKQSPFAWPIHLFVASESLEDPTQYIQFDTNQVDALRVQLGLNNENRPEARAAHLAIEEGKGYTIQSEVYGKQISTDSLSKAMKLAFLEREQQFDLNKAYIQPEKKADDPELVATLQKISAIQDVPVTLKFDGQTINVPKEEIAQWIAIESDKVEVDASLIKEYISKLNKQYAAVYKEREFQSTYQGTVTVQPGTYGWYINAVDEAEAIREDLLAQREVNREPSIGGTGYGLKEDIGGNYVEVDLLYQTMFIYYDHQLVFTTPITSGRPGAETVPGAYQVWFKEADTNLVGIDPFSGADYAAPVNFWIAFDDNAQGIHDASWQSSFGGNAYLYTGSLGCINVSPSVMGQVYEYVYYGMPVIVY